ncbi:hypothetical protein HNR68_000363 [Saccharopolyspora hordei]|uniref:DUF664 domain-containing protein n=1 Tax=Saccharopolyspora hordei TaxID=1838 RepID=A0A853AHF8_9PSEU|nr:hypothetical protein [Saccharopolyspora hordei]
MTVHSARWGQDTSLRAVVLHVIIEYARHNGHADFLREAIDGTVGVCGLRTRRPSRRRRPPPAREPRARRRPGQRPA